MPRFTAPAAGLLALAALPAAAEEAARPTIWDALTVENFATSFVHTALSWARLLADIRYEQVSVDPVALRVTITGADIVPLIPDFPEGSCRVKVDRITINGGPLDRISEARLRLAFDGFDATAGCLPLDGANMMRALGYATVHADRADVEYTYDYASGGATVRLATDIESLAALTLTADFDYISFRMNFVTEEPAFAADLNRAELWLEDRGGWAVARNFLPQELQSPGALGPAVSAGLSQTMRQANGTGAALSDRQAAFAEAAGQVADRFAEHPQGVVLATHIETRPLRLDEVSTARFRPLFDALNPSIGTEAPEIQAALPVSELQAALETDTPPQDAFALGRALITGIGAPRNLGSGLKLLAPLARDGNREASLLIARAVADRRPADAYAHALRAAAAGLPGSLALLDRLERTLTFDEILRAQGTLMGNPEEALYGDLPGMRRAARAFLTGTTRPRSWQAAYYWASMAAAAGDPTGAGLRDEIDDMLRLRGDAEAWAQEAERLDNGVLRDWIAKDVPARLR